MRTHPCPPTHMHMHTDSISSLNPAPPGAFSRNSLQAVCSRPHAQRVEKNAPLQSPSEDLSQWFCKAQCADEKARTYLNLRDCSSTKHSITAGYGCTHSSHTHAHTHPHTLKVCASVVVQAVVQQWACSSNRCAAIGVQQWLAAINRCAAIVQQSIGVQQSCSNQLVCSDRAAIVVRSPTIESNESSP